MPNILAHVLMGEATAGLLSFSAAKTAEKHRNTFHLGAQGPDVLFYSNPWPWAKDRRVSALGGEMHTRETGCIFREMLLFASDPAWAKEERDRLAAYLMGYVCHYYLDSIAHPYIHSLVGFDPLHDNRTLSSKYEHSWVEAKIDTVMVARIKGRKAAS
ncbi:MAG TPA: hypothetical protein DD727_05295, partial [Clostridiales bacterium]|nr:hypothetical protein [Clostridiales bacterium]